MCKTTLGLMLFAAIVCADECTGDSQCKKGEICAKYTDNYGHDDCNNTKKWALFKSSCKCVKELEPEGAQCSDSSECKRNLICNKLVKSLPICTKQVEEGEKCLDESYCKDNLICNELQTVDGHHTCTKPVGQGGECTWRSIGTMCQRNPTKLVCNYLVNPKEEERMVAHRGVCTPHARPGEKCVWHPSGSMCTSKHHCGRSKDANLLETLTCINESVPLNPCDNCCSFFQYCYPGKNGLVCSNATRFALTISALMLFAFF